MITYFIEFTNSAVKEIEKLNTEISKKIRNVHPGEILREEFMIPLNLTSYRIAQDTKIQTSRINQILLEKRGISADTALRLSKFFRNSPEF